MITFFTTIHVIACVFLVILVLLQSGKGAEISASFGGSSQTVFGASGGANFFTRLTSGMAAVFMLTAVILTTLHAKSKQSLFDSVPASQLPKQTAPAVPASAEASKEAAPATNGAPPAAPEKPATNH